MLHIICYVAAAVLNLVWLLLGDELHLTHQLAVPVLTVVIAGAGVLLRLRTLPRAAWRRYLRGSLWVLFCYYLFLLLVLLFFGGLFHMDRGWGGTVNLEPFHTIRNYIRFYRNTGSYVSIMNLLGNVAIMVPLGVLLPLLFWGMRHFWTFLPLAALVSVGVEYIQWRTATGAADVDDCGRLHFEFPGGLFGVLLCTGVPDGVCRLCAAASERRIAVSETMKFRKAVPGDEGLILTFIRELADYEGMLDQVVADEATLHTDQVVADEATLHTWIFEKEKAEVLFVLEGETEVGFALFFHNFSTFLGRAGLYLEDLYVRPECRGKGYGKALFRKLAPGLRQDGVVVPGLEPALH